MRIEPCLGSFAQFQDRQDRKKKPHVPKLEEEEGIDAEVLRQCASTLGVSVDVRQGSAGLTVIIRDQSGNQIRALGGKEFLRLQAAAKNSGKLLDKKVY